MITDPWCGDAAQSLPYFARIVKSSPNIELKIVLHDENPGLMDAFLNNESRTIPKLIVVDKTFQVNHWGPQSKAVAIVVNDYIQKHSAVYDQLKTDLQIWYNNYKGKSILQEMMFCENEV